MKQIGTVTEVALESLKGQKLQSSKDSAYLTLRNDPVGKKTLGVLLSQCFDSMKLYGREPEQLESTAALFNFVLSDFPIDKITQAFVFHLQNSSEMPTPADICNIIKRGNKPPLERSVYVSIGKKPSDQRTSDEWRYMREYEEFLINGE